MNNSEEWYFCKVVSFELDRTNPVCRVCDLTAYEQSTRISTSANEVARKVTKQTESMFSSEILRVPAALPDPTTSHQTGGIRRPAS